MSLLPVPDTALKPHQARARKEPSQQQNLIRYVMSYAGEFIYNALHFCFFFLCSHCKPLWVSVFCTSSHQAFLSLMRYVQFLTFNFFKSFSTSSFHLFFGRPLDLIPMGFHSVIFLAFFFHPVKMSPLCYPLCSYVFNYILSSY
jgi:uncharacterized membrane protein